MEQVRGSCHVRPAVSEFSKIRSQNISIVSSVLKEEWYACFLVSSTVLYTSSFHRGCRKTAESTLGNRYLIFEYYIYCLCVSGADLDRVCSDPVLREGHHWDHSEGWGPQCPRVVWGSSATRFHDWCSVHVPTGQCLWVI